MEKNIKANIQLLDSYIKEYEMKVDGKIDEKAEVELSCSISFGIVKIEEKENEKIGQIDMQYTIDLIKEEKSIGKIRLVIQALFSTNKELTNEKFEEMLKYNGASTLSQIIRAYLITNTSLSGMPTINLPMINFVEFFRDADKDKQKNLTKK